MGLSQYVAKRNFSQTREPKGATKKLADNTQRFVVQKHDASRLHYDFRLQMEGVLKSWAVPKGFPTVKGDKRLAMQVEDHPVEYATFEGIIPPGNYGAGTVMLWDVGTFEVLDDQPLTALRKGKLSLRLAGKKLKGQWTLVRMRRTQDGSENAWLIIKSGESVPEISARTDDRSVISRRGMKRIAADAGSVWQSDRKKTSRFAKKPWSSDTPKKRSL